MGIIISKRSQITAAEKNIARIQIMNKKNLRVPQKQELISLRTFFPKTKQLISPDVRFLKEKKNCPASFLGALIYRFSSLFFRQ